MKSVATDSSFIPVLAANTPHGKIDSVDFLDRNLSQGPSQIPDSQATFGEL